MGMLRDPKNNELAEMLGMGAKRLRRLERMTRPRAEDELLRIQSSLGERFKAAAFALHPDRNQSDPDATEKFARLSAIRDAIAALNFSPRNRRTPSRVKVEGVIKVPTEDELEQHGGIKSRGSTISFFS